MRQELDRGVDAVERADEGRVLSLSLSCVCVCVCVYVIAEVDANGERRRGRTGTRRRGGRGASFVDGERARKWREEDKRKGASSVPRQGALPARPLADLCPLTLFVCLCVCVAMQPRQCPSSHTRKTEEGKKEGRACAPAVRGSSGEWRALPGCARAEV